MLNYKLFWSEYYLITKDFYVTKIGHDYNRIKNSVWYLSELSITSAIELDNYIIGRNKNFEHLAELSTIFEEYKLKDTDNALTEPLFPFMPLMRAIEKISQKKIKYYSELALNFNLLNLELKNVPRNFNMLGELRSFLCDFSRELSLEKYNLGYRLVG